MAKEIQERRKRTEKGLLDAFGAVLAAQGFQALTLRGVAEQAAVNKALVSRYFGSFDGLAKAYADSVNFWPTVEEVLGETVVQALERTPSDRLHRIIDRYPQTLQSRPETLAVLAWETIERNAVTEKLENVRSEFNVRLVGVVANGLKHKVDLMGLSATISATTHYLLVRSRNIQTFAGIDLHSKEGWIQLLKPLHDLADFYLAAR